MTSKSLLALAVAGTLAAGSGGVAAPAGATTTTAATTATTATTATAVTASSASSASSADVEIPATPAGRQLRWMLDALTRAPVPESEIKEHVAAGYLEQVPPEQFNQTFQGWKAFTLTAVDGAGPTSLTAKGTLGGQGVRVTLRVDGDGKINWVSFDADVPPAPTSWKELQGRLAEAAPQYSFLAAEITDRRCRPAQVAGAQKARPLGSMFKLYVLGAVAEQIRAGAYTWDTQLTITPELKSLGGELSARPDGSKVSVFETAKLMIGISDNTATDLLIHKAGRKAVEQTMRAWGGRKEGNVPFLTTRELFVLKGADYPEHADAYKRLGTRAKRAYLRDTVAKVPLTAIRPWVKPRELETLEWFASPAEICRAHAELRRSPDPKVDDVMSSNSGLLAKGTWFKGGEEVGLTDLGYSYRAGKKVSFITVMTTNPSSPFPPGHTYELISLAQGAVKLLK
ncbi:serine hydrolase [Nonomuraea typhae]|uniref:serine hydrolase n=1 Tax=Nonomuraea typhae TaxID=2603600 RepID=UPI0012F74B2B|nr:serine hydrolase [Nonomuraea typhae]